MDTNPAPGPQTPSSHGPSDPPPPPQSNASTSQPPSRAEASPIDKKVGCAGAVIMCLGLILTIGTCGRDETEGKSIEYKMACIDAGKKLDEDDSKVREFKRLLDDLAAQFDSTDSKIAAMTISVVESLEKDGIQVSHLELLEAAQRASTGGHHKQLGLTGESGYAQTLAMIATLKASEHKRR